MGSISTLRAITNRLNSTPVEDLPHQVGYLATSIASCRDLLRDASPKNDLGVLLHKLKTRVSSLLQDRTAEGRFSGICIAKAVAEAGGTTILSDSGNWVRAIISCLNKSDPAEVKKLGVLAVTRIYLLTVDNQALVRGVTVPTLPAFMSATLSIIRPSTSTSEGKTTRALSPLLEVVLNSWDALIERFSSTIRPNSVSIRSICLSLVSDEGCSLRVQEAAQHVLAKLHFCAPKDTAATDWSQSCAQLIEAAHDTADLVFRAVVEVWSPATPRALKVTRKQKSASVPSTSAADAAGLDPWSGITQGCSRIQSHLRLLRRFFTGSHSSGMSIPMGLLNSLAARLAVFTPPTANFTPRLNNDITREEREELWLNLPRLHTSLLQLFEALIHTFQETLTTLSPAIAGMAWEIFDAESDNEAIRAATYRLFTLMLSSRLLVLTKHDSSYVKSLIKHCCQDLRPPDAPSTNELSLTNGSSDSKKGSTNGMQSSDLNHSTRIAANHSRTSLYLAAYALLPALLTHGNLHALDGSSGLRAQLDSTAILINHYEGILASVLHPPNSRTTGQQGKRKPPTPSLLPFLARSAQYSTGSDTSGIKELAYEALLRPRMPVVRSRTSGIHDLSNLDEAAEDDVSGTIPDHESNSRPATDELTDTDVPMASATTLDENNPVPSSLLPNQDTTSLSNTPKRDFTALLDQSADEQLAASIADDTSTPSTAIPKPTYESLTTTLDTTTNKRQKTATDQATITLHAIETTIPTTMDNAVYEPVPQNAAIAPPSFEAESKQPNILAMQPTSKPTQSHESRGKYRDEDTDSSDSEVPAIDATLVGFSDSEDEDDDEV